MSDAEDTFIEQIKRDYQNLIGVFPSKIGWNNLIPTIKSVAAVAEQTVVNSQKLTGPEKRNAVVKIIDDLLKLPFYLEAFDGIVIGWIVDAIISAWNDFAHDWLSKLGILPQRPVTP